MWTIFMSLSLCRMSATMYYLDVNFYRYFIGRSDQSVNEKVMTGRIDQQIKVNQIMTDYFVEKKSEIMSNKPLAKYMLSYLDIITTISSILLIRINTPESLEKKRELLNYISQKDQEGLQKTALRSFRKLYESAWKNRKMDFCGRLQNLPEVFWLQLIEKNLVVLCKLC